jgi:Amt family ammonium transporter
VLSAHGVGGIVGALLTGILAEKKWNGAANGALFGNSRQFGIQLIAVIATIAFSAVMTFVILQVMTLVVRVRASAHEQGIGLDISQHGEEAYSRGEGAILILPEEGGMVDEVSPGYRTA